MVSSQPIRVACPACQSVVSVERQQGGQRITCPQCLEEFVAELTDPTPVRPKRGLADTTEYIPLAETTEYEGLPPSLGLPPQPAAGTESSAELPEADYEFDVQCPLCGTRQDATRQSIGQTLRCPDCEFLIKVQEPPPRARRLPGERSAEDDELRLSEVSAARPVHDLAHEYLEKARSEVARGRAERKLPAFPMHDALHRAGTEVQVDDVSPPRLPPRPLRSRLLRFLWEPAALIRALILAIGLFFELLAVRRATELFFGGPFEQFLCVMLLAFSAIYGFALFAAVAITLLAVLQDTAEGKDVIENWPEGNFLDWFAEAAYVLVALFVAAFPGVLLGRLVSYLAPDSSSVGWEFVFCIPTTFVLFPIALLSALEAGSPLNVLSRPILRSLSVLARGWLQFYFWSGLLSTAGFVALAFAIAGPLWMGVVSMAVIAPLLMVYFRLLGRLAWWCREEVAEAEERHEGHEAHEEDEAANAGPSRGAGSGEVDP